MTSNFGKWLAWLVSSFGILYKNSVSYWKKGVFANLPKKNSLTTTYVLGQPFEVTVDFWCDLWVEKTVHFLCVSSPVLIFGIFSIWGHLVQETTEVSPFDPHFTFTRLFLVNRQKLRFFKKNPTFLIKYQISPLVRPIICQNLRSFGQETTEISPFDPLVDSNEKR